MTRDKADKLYWDRTWDNAPLPRVINPYARDLNNYVYRKFHEFFREVLSQKETKDKKLLEIGCARSIWLPYFVKEFGFKVYGIDYSEIGCHQAMQILLNEGLRGEVIHSDFFSPPEFMIGAFDVVVSLGVVEHFQDTVGCVGMLTKFLKPGGILITNIPNLIGLVGLVQKYFNRDIFNIHVPLSAENLGDAHRRNGLHLILCHYFLVANFGILNLENLKGNACWAWILPLRSWISKAIWVCEKSIPFLRPNRWSSPYINCVAMKP